MLSLTAVTLAVSVCWPFLYMLYVFLTILLSLCLSIRFTHTHIPTHAHTQKHMQAHTHHVHWPSDGGRSRETDFFCQQREQLNSYESHFSTSLIQVCVSRSIQCACVCVGMCVCVHAVCLDPFFFGPHTVKWSKQVSACMCVCVWVCVCVHRPHPWMEKGSQHTRKAPNPQHYEPISPC